MDPSAGDPSSLLAGLVQADSAATALQTVLRTVAGTGRLPRSVLKAVTLYAANSDQPAALRVIAFEILWFLVSDRDVLGYRGVMALARGNMTTSDHPDLMLTAVTTLASLPPSWSVDIMLVDEAEKAMVDSMTGDAPGAVRAAAAATFANLALTAVAQVAAAGTASATPVDSVIHRERLRLRCHDKAVEVCKGVIRLVDDADVVVAAAAMATLRRMMDVAPAVSEGAAGEVRVVGTLAGRLVATMVAAPSTPGVASADTIMAVAAVWEAMDRVHADVARRLWGRLPSLQARVLGLGPHGAAHGVRIITLLLAWAAWEASRGGAVEPATLAHMDGVPPAAAPSVAALLYRWMTVGLPCHWAASPTSRLHAASAATLAGSRGWGTAVSLASTQAGVGAVDVATSPTSHVAALEALRCFSQLAHTFGPAVADRACAARCRAASTSVADVVAAVGAGTAASYGTLQPSLPRTQWAATAAAVLSPTAAATAAALSVHAAYGSITGGPAPTVSWDAATLAFDPHRSMWVGRLLPPLAISHGASIPHPSHVTAAVTAAVRQVLPMALGRWLSLLRGVHHITPTSPLSKPHASPVATGASGGGGGVITATAGFVIGGGGGVGGGGGDVLPTSPAAAPLTPGDPAVIAAAGTLVSAGKGLGAGGGTPLMTQGMLQAVLIGAMAAAVLAPAHLALALAPALLREVGRVADDVVEDVGAGQAHNLRRVCALTSLCTLVTHIALHDADVAPTHSLHPYSTATLPKKSAAMVTLGREGGGGDVGGRGGVDRGGTGGGSVITLGGGDRHGRGGGGGGGGVASSGGLGLVSARFRPPPLPPSITVARIVYEATRTVLPAFGEAASSLSAASVSSLAAGAAVSAAGDVHASEVAATSNRFRCELGGVALQCLARGAPHASLLGRVVDVTLGIDEPQEATCPARVDDAEALHHWLSATLDTLASQFALLEHRISYGGVGMMGDRKVASLAAIIAKPDDPASAPEPLPLAPPVSLYADDVGSGGGGGGGGGGSGGGGGGGSDGGGSTAGRTTTSTAAGSGGVGLVTGWGWIREYEACVEATECFMNALTAVCAVLYPPPLPATYGSFNPPGHTAMATSICPALALDVLPPALLALHRTKLSRLLFACSKLNLKVYDMYEVERSVAATAPKMMPTTTPALTSSPSRGGMLDALPSAVPLQLRLLWLLCAVWDGSDGISVGAVGGGGGRDGGTGGGGGAGAPTATIGSSASSVAGGGGGAGPRALTGLALAASLAGGGSGVVATPGMGGTGGLATVSAAESLFRQSLLGPSALQSALKDMASGSGLAARLALLSADESTNIATEAVRQKRLATLVATVVGEASRALGIATDLETAAERAVGYIRAMVEGKSPLLSSSPPQTAGPGVTAPASAPSPAPAPATGAGAGTSTGWLSTSRIGKALGFLGSSTPAPNTAGASKGPEPIVFSGDSTVVSYPHFWLLVDMMAVLAASQRCTAGQIKRAVECMLVQPKLAPDVFAVLLNLLPRACLFTAVYGRSSLARELASHATPAITTTTAKRAGALVGACGSELRAAVSLATIFGPVVQEAWATGRDPWSFVHFDPTHVISPEGRLMDVTKQAAGQAALGELNQYRKLAGPPLAPAGRGGTEDANAAISVATAAGAREVEAIPAGGPSPLGMAAELLTTTALACIAAAAAPDLLQNATTGLNRSAASGARMRTTVPMSAAHGTGLTHRAAMHVLRHTGSAAAASDAVWRGGPAAPRAHLLNHYVGGVPTALTAYFHRLRAATAAGQRHGGPKVCITQAGMESAVASATSRVRRCHRIERYFSQLSATGGLPGGGGGEGHDLAPPQHVSVGDALTVVSSSSDPLLIRMGHAASPAMNRMTVTVAVTNHTRLRLPAGMTVALAVAGPATFDRGAITAAQVSSSSSRLGVGGSGGGSGLGSASVGAALQADLIVLQRSGCLHATVTLAKAVPAGDTVVMHFTLIPTGMGSVQVTTTVTCDAVEVHGWDADEPSGAVAAAARAGAVIGACEAEWGGGMDDGEDDGGVAWGEVAAPGSHAGHVNGEWGAWSGSAPTTSSAGDGVIWSGQELNPLPTARRSRMLSGAASATLSISRLSAAPRPTVPTPAAPGRPGAMPTPTTVAGGGGGSDDGVMRGWGMRDREREVAGSPSTSLPARAGGGGGGGRERRHSGVSSAFGLREEEGGRGGHPSHDADSAYGGDEGEDDVGSVSGSTAITAGAPVVDIDLDAAGSAGGSSFRPFAIHRLTITTAMYRIPWWTVHTHPAAVHMPHALATAVAAGVDVLPGAATAFGAFGLPSQLALAALDGGGLSLPLHTRLGTPPVAMAGSILSIAHLPFVSWASRLPYTHFGLAVSASMSSAAPRPPQSTARWLHDTLAHGLCRSGGGYGWAPVPLPMVPRGDPVLSAHPVVLDACQAAFAAVTTAGTNLALLATAVCVDDPTRHEAVWQVSLHFRCDDARVRAVAAAEFHELVHGAGCGHLVLLQHGNGPSLAGLLANLDIMAPPASPAAWAAAASPASNGAPTAPGALLAGPSDAHPHSGLSGGQAMVGAPTAMVEVHTAHLLHASAGMQQQQGGAWYPATRSAFTLLPHGVLEALTSIEGWEAWHPPQPDGAFTGDDSEDVATAAGGASSTAVAAAGGAAIMSLDDFFSSGVSDPVASAPFPAGAGQLAAKSAPQPAPSPGFDPFA